MNKKFMITLSVVALLAVVLGVTGTVFAQSGEAFVTEGEVTPTPIARRGFGPGFGSLTESPMHDAMLAALADGLGMTSEELQAKIDAGGTLYTIAAEKGLEDTAITDLWQKAHATAIDQAVANGLFSQEWADWMEERMQQRPGGIGGFCNGAGGFRRGGMMGGWRGAQGQAQTQTTP